jgi:LmbE family N-acetylglucosaminyl deacetylase
MRFSHAQADVYVPDGSDPELALGKLTQLCIGAHQDDIEIMAQAGISDCLASNEEHFGGVVLTNGSGSPRSGPYSDLSDEAMSELRRTEQRTAARLGQYAIQIQLDHPSSAIKQKGNPALTSDLHYLFTHSQPHTLYLHNPSDKHDTHVAAVLRCIEVLRELSPEQRPKKIYGCEVWRSLDWLMEDDAIALDSGRDPKLGAALLSCFQSQIAGGKRYDLATLGRRQANASFHRPHRVDQAQGITWACDLNPLVQDKPLSLETFLSAQLDRFKQDALDRIARLS